MNELLTLVVDRPLDELPSELKRAHCFQCGSNRLSFGSSMTTLLGGGNGVDDDPNHTWTGVRCNECGFSFTRETQRGKVWYTHDKGKLLAGVPTCFESYVYTCVHCAGRVLKDERELDGVTTATCIGVSFEDGYAVRNYRTFYKCLSCKREVEEIYTAPPVRSLTTAWTIEPPVTLRAIISNEAEKEIGEYLDATRDSGDREES